MAEQQRIVVRETIRSRDLHGEDAVRFHLIDRSEPRDDTGVAILCGGQIVLPPPTEKVPTSEVCGDCLAGRVTI